MFIDQEKEKELEVRNIYALRHQRPPHRLDSSISSTPVPLNDIHRPLQRARLQNIRSEGSVIDSEKDVSTLRTICD